MPSLFSTFRRAVIQFSRARPKSIPYNSPRNMASTSAATSVTRDPNTLSNYNCWKTKHTIADLALDFKKQRVHGTITLQLESLTDRGSEEIILDSSFVDVQDISVNGTKIQEWALKDRTEPFGSPLSIKVNGGAAKNSVVSVAIGLSTTEKCTALQWMTPAQTSNKKFPYMFSQCQAIHCRSIFPCQDTPDVKSTYEFRIRSELPVVASGLPRGSSAFVDGVNGEPGSLLYSFYQEIPIPSYLFALASGDVATASIGPRSQVITGPEEVLAAKWEFEADMENFLQVAEKIVYPYPWTLYNILVLPTSFPCELYLIYYCPATFIVSNSNC